MSTTAHLGKLHRRKDVKGDEASSERHTWYLIGPRGATQFACHRYLRDTSIHRVLHHGLYPVDGGGDLWMGADVGYHSPKPPGREMDGCPVLEGPCFYDGSGLAGMELAQKWVEAGCDDEVIWALLESQYRWQFHGEET